MPVKISPYFGTYPDMTLHKVKVKVMSEVMVVIPALNADRALAGIKREWAHDKKYTSGELLEEVFKRAKISDMEVL